MANGHEIKWTPKECDDYKYDGKYFIVMKNGAWLEFYNLDYVISISVLEEV